MFTPSPLESQGAAVALHGTLVELFGTGVLLRGRSGSGKSELALGLVDRGHRLVADDMVEFTAANGLLNGTSRPGCGGFIEVRGLGIFDLRLLHGEGAVAQSAPLGLVLTLETADDGGRWRGDGRLHCRRRDWSLLGLSVMEIALPATRHRNLPLLAETALRLSRHWRQGYDGAAELEANLTALMSEESA